MMMTAAVVVITSVAVERSGPLLGALIGALPTAAGAAYTILALEHTPDFIAASAIGSVAINGAVAIFAAIYALLAQRHGLLVSLSGAGIVWFAIAGALQLVDWTPLSAVVLNVAASSRIGSFASGMFAIFPIILGSSIVIMHPRIGGKATASMMAHVQLPLIGLALGFLVVHYLVAPIGVWPALAVGLAVSLAWSSLLLVLRLRQQRRQQAISASPTAS